MLSRLVRSRERVRAEAAEVVQMKSDFVSMVSHELRTPLASVEVSMDLLTDETPLRGDRQKIAATMRRSVHRLNHLVDDLIDLGRVDAGQLAIKLGPVRAPDAIQNALRIVEHQFRAKKQAVITECGADLPPLLADRERLEQVLVNLLTNASKYTPQGGQIRVAACQNGGASAPVRLEVVDTGPGLSAEEQQYIFQKYFRGSMAQHHAGIGLGLTIALALVQLQNGKLSVHSEQGRGATFRVEFPVAVAGAGA
jgi:signal transduction histidine kinase